MKRLFADHTVRQVQCLDGAWNFCADPADVGKQQQWYTGLKQAKTVVVPSVWNTEFGMVGYEGVAWYQTKFYTRGGTLRFVFEAVMTYGEVWLDNTPIGSHYGGYCQFECIAAQVAEGWHQLTVRVDNRFDKASIPQAVVDWYHYGGIPRSVFVETLSGLCVLENRFDYTLSDDMAAADVSLTLQLYNAQPVACTAPVQVTLGETVLWQSSVTLQGGQYQTVHTPAVTVNDIRLWDVGKPELYELTAVTDTDDLIDRVGFRKIEVKNQQVLLNGKAVELLGVNRHEDHPEFGQAFPPALMPRDLDIIEDMGCNTVRGSHYPNARLFVDMMDARGILFWSEIPIWGGGFSEEALADPAVVQRGLDMHREMVRHYYNHPCIVLWGMHNEIKTASTAAYNMSQIYYQYLKNNGGNRLVSYATDNPMGDICLEFCDIICINKYYGWYGNEGLAGWPNFLKNFRQRREQLGFAHKPVVISEFGAAALYGTHTFDNIRWTEEYQAELLSFCLDLFHNDPMVVGMYIWQFCDIRSTNDLGRARGFNNKGIVNEHRKPKQAYFAVKEKYRLYGKN